MKTFDYSSLEQKQWGTDILNLVARIHECKGRQDLFVKQKPVELETIGGNCQNSKYRGIKQN